MEIERKYLVEKYPYSLTDYKKKKIIQGYISKDPVIRIRRSNDDYFLTVKGKGLMVREEFEMVISKDQFNQLSTKVDGLLITKTRYLLPYESHIIELDIFKGPLDGLIMAEVEFDSIDASKDFIAPTWFLKEVTKDSRYQNNRLSDLTSLETIK